MKISIITTIYKAEKDLPRLLDSMMSQKSKELEFYLIDNGSPDHCGEICSEYVKKDSRFVLVSLVENIGYIAARNYGIEHCSGDYIGFCDSDDFLEQGGYDHAVEIIKKTDCDLYMTSWNTVTGNTIKKNDLPYEVGKYIGQDVNSVVLPNAYGPINGKGILHGFAWKMIYRHSIVKINNISFMEALKPYEDQIFNIDVINKCNTVYVDDKVIYNYISSTTSITGQMSRKYDAFAEWGRITALFHEKMKRANTIAEHIAICNHNSYAFYSIVLNISKTKKHIKEISEILDSIIDSSMVNYTLANYNVKSLKIRFTMFCVKMRLFSFVVTIVRCLLK